MGDGVKRASPRRKWLRRTSISHQNGVIAEATVRELTKVEMHVWRLAPTELALWCALDDVWVSTNHRRQGLATQVVRQAMELAKRDGRTVVCRVHPHGPGRCTTPQLEQLYLGCDFARVQTPGTEASGDLWLVWTPRIVAGWPLNTEHTDAAAAA